MILLSTSLPRLKHSVLFPWDELSARYQATGKAVAFITDADAPRAQELIKVMLQPGLLPLPNMWFL